MTSATVYLYTVSQCFRQAHSEIALIGLHDAILQVLMNDQIIFESIKTAGQYLHCSADFLGQTGQQLHSK